MEMGGSGRTHSQKETIHMFLSEHRETRQHTALSTFRNGLSQDLWDLSPKD